AARLVIWSVRNGVRRCHRQVRAAPRTGLWPVSWIFGGALDAQTTTGCVVHHPTKTLGVRAGRHRVCNSRDAPRFRGDPGWVADTSPVSAPPPPCRTPPGSPWASTKIQETGPRARAPAGSRPAKRGWPVTGGPARAPRRVGALHQVETAELLVRLGVRPVGQGGGRDQHAPPC